MTTRSFYFVTCIVIAFVISCSVSANAEEMIQSLQKKDKVERINGVDVFAPVIDGKKLEYGAQLPEGFRWNPDGTLEMPEGVRINSDGTLALPNNEYPEPYKVQADGSVEGPNGVKLQNKKPVNPFSIADALAKLEEKIEDKGKDEQPDKNDKPNEKKPKEKKPKPDNKLRIPSDAAKKNDLSFLAGCWKTDAKTGGSWEGGGVWEVSERMCFDRNGRGQFQIKEKRGTYSGPITARLNNGKLSFKAGNAYAKGHMDYYTPNDMACDGSDDNTRCLRVMVNPRNKAHKRYANLVLTRSK